MRKVKFEDAHAYFHGFFNASDGELVALVEKLNGKMTYMHVHQLEFINPPTFKPENTNYKPGDIENGTY